MSDRVAILSCVSEQHYTLSHRLRAALDANLHNRIDLVASCQRHKA
jgi:hypothetical protein